MKKLILLGVFFSLFLFLASTQSPEFASNIKDQPSDIHFVSDYTSHGSIAINHDDNLTSQGWPGDGSKDSPYLIENLSIIADQTCISISNTRKHIEINNCKLESNTVRNGNGITLSNVTNCVIQNCSTGLKATAFDLTSCVNCSIEASISNDNTNGFVLSQCNSTIVYNNSVTAGGTGISVSNSYECTIKENRIFDNPGISVSSSGVDVLFIRNEIIDSGGLSLGNTRFIQNRVGNSGKLDMQAGLNATDNVLYGTGINRIDDDCWIVGNWIMATSENGIYAQNGMSGSSHNSTLVNNTICGHSDYGIEFYYEGDYFLSAHGNRFGWNTAGNVVGATWKSIEWDDGVSQGNAWSDYDGTGSYTEGGVNDSYPTLLVDETAPMLEPTPDITIEAGTYGHQVVWNASDNFPATYDLYLNNTKMPSAAWFNDTVEYPIDFVDPGVYNYTIVLYDAIGHNVSDTVFVTVIDTISPTLDEPADIQYEGGSTGNEVTWTPSDSYPDAYSLDIDGTEVDSGGWGGGVLTLSVDGLVPGVHNATLTVFDTSSNSKQDTVRVTVVDTTHPVINSPSNTQYECGTTGNTITWTPDDLFPSKYSILENGTEVDSGNWDGSSIPVNIDGMSPGYYNYSIQVNDTTGNAVMDTVWVNVTDTTNPTLGSPEDFQFEAGESGHSISWTASELNPEEYWVFKNGEIYESGTWEGTSVTVYLFDLSPGNYNFTIRLTDTSGNDAVDSVYVDVSDTTSPTISGPDDTYYEEKTLGNTITWDADDLFPHWYQIHVNGTLVQNGPWNGSVIVIEIDGLPLGIHNYTLTAIDTSANEATKTTIVHVITNEPPQIDNPDDIKYKVDDGIGFIIWHPSDSNPSGFMLLRNSTEIQSGVWNGSQIAVNVSGLSLGIYNYTLIVTDIAGRQAVDTVFVLVVVELVKPTISSPDDIEYTYLQEGNTVVWNTYDEYPWRWKLFHNQSLQRQANWNTSVLSISVDGLDVGWHNMTMVLFDESRNWISDTVMVHVLPLPSPQASGPENVDHQQGASSNIITWQVSSPAPSHYEIYDNEVLIEQESWDGEDISFDLNRLSPGHHVLKLKAYDMNGNSAEHITEVQVGQGLQISLDQSYMILLALIAGVIVALTLFRLAGEAKKDEKERKWHDILSDI